MRSLLHLDGLYVVGNAARAHACCDASPSVVRTRAAALLHPYLCNATDGSTAPTNTRNDQPHNAAATAAPQSWQLTPEYRRGPCVRAPPCWLAGQAMLPTTIELSTQVPRHRAGTPTHAVTQWPRTARNTGRARARGQPAQTNTPHLHNTLCDTPWPATPAGVQERCLSWNTDTRELNTHKQQNKLRHAAGAQALHQLALHALGSTNV